MPLNFGGNSRFRRDPLILVDGRETLGTWGRPAWLTSRPAANLVGSFQVTSELEGKPDLIAQQIYGIESLDWVLIAFNAPRKLLGWPRAGDVIEYPAESVVIPSL